MKKFNKILTVLVFVVLVTVLMIVSSSAASVPRDILNRVEHHPGYMIDYDGNNTVDSDDAIYLLYHTYFPSEYKLDKCKNTHCTADVNEDGKKDADDAILVLYAVMGLEEVCPIEGHTAVSFDGIESTCGEIGITGGKYCIRCGAFTEAPTYAERTAHFVITGSETCFVCEEEVCDDDEDMIVYVQSSGSSGYSVTRANKYVKGKVTIPAKVDDKPITKIEEYAFWRADITEVIIPNTVTEIGSMAFDSCGKLEEIELPESVTKLGTCSFAGCTSLKYINIPSKVTYIGDYAFSGSALKTIRFDVVDGWSGVRTDGEDKFDVSSSELADSSGIATKLCTGGYKIYIFSRTTATDSSDPESSDE